MTQDHLHRNTPESQGIQSEAIRDFVLAADQAIQSMHSFMLLRHGVVVAEGWWHPYRPESPHMLFSLSKSFTSTAIGLAVNEGLLTLDDPVLKFFPKDAPRKTSPNLAAMRVRHLLSMSTGHHEDTTEHIMRARNPFKAFLGLAVEHEPGTHFVYNSGASYMLAAIVQKLTGQTLAGYLSPRLFEPLGIEGAVWDSHPNGVNFGGWGLNIKTEDIARFGQLYLQKGQWNRRQLIPVSWVEAATSKQVSNGPDKNLDWEQGYGYQFWRCQPASIYRGDGAFGQFCVVMPEQDAVLAITAGSPEMQPILNLVWEKLLPGIQAAALPENASAVESLVETLKHLHLSPTQGKIASPESSRISGQVYTFEPNDETLHSLSLDFSTNTLTYRLLGGGARRGKHRLGFGIGAWVEGTSALRDFIPRKVAASGAWISDNTFRLTLCRYETPFVATFDFRFEGSQVFFDARVNVDFGPTESPQLIGTSA